MSTVTITLTDLPAFEVRVLTDADAPTVGRPLTPAESMALELLATARHAGGQVEHAPQHIALVALALDLISPEGYGHAVPPEVRARAKQALGPRMGQLVPQPWGEQAGA